MIVAGEQVIVWGGMTGGSGLRKGAFYYPSPIRGKRRKRKPHPCRYFHTSVWTGEAMLVWGGLPLSGDDDSLDAYNADVPATPMKKVSTGASTPWSKRAEAVRKSRPGAKGTLPLRGLNDERASVQEGGCHETTSYSCLSLGCVCPFSCQRFLVTSRWRKKGRWSSTATQQDDIERIMQPLINPIRQTYATKPGNDASEHP